MDDGPVELHSFLERNPGVSAFNLASEHFGGGGVTKAQLTTYN